MSSDDDPAEPDDAAGTRGRPGSGRTGWSDELWVPEPPTDSAFYTPFGWSAQRRWWLGALVVMALGLLALAAWAAIAAVT